MPPVGWVRAKRDLAPAPGPKAPIAKEKKSRFFDESIFHFFLPFSKGVFVFGHLFCPFFKRGFENGLFFSKMSPVTIMLSFSKKGEKVRLHIFFDFLNFQKKDLDICLIV